MAQQQGCRTMPVGDAYQRLCTAGGYESGPLIILRHDVDSDPVTAREMWRIEKQLSLRATCYFRLPTLDVNFMKELEAEDGEAGAEAKFIAWPCELS